MLPEIHLEWVKETALGATSQFTSLTRRKSFEQPAVEEVLEFCSAWPLRPFHSPALIRKFLTAFTSGPEMVFDIFLESERVACAVLLDRVDNPGNNACLEVLALRPGEHVQAVYELLLSEAKRSLPQSRAGIEATLHPDTPVGEEFFSDRGFVPSYGLFDMIKLSSNHRRICAPEGYGWRTFEVSDLPALHATLKEVFAQNPETSVPDFETMARDYAAGGVGANPYTLLLKGKDIVGFVKVALQSHGSLAEPTSGFILGEISIIGVTPSERGRGLGRVALSRALDELEQKGATQFKLTVAAANERALSMYQSFGFTVNERSLCLLYSPVE
jgi:ribosomal protein S18 acetylase RimI-like enzyme